MKRLLIALLGILIVGGFFVSCGNGVISLPDDISISFTDTDMGSGQIAGTVVITRPADETDIESYVVYWGSAVGMKLADTDPIEEIAVTETEISVTIAENTPVPAGADYLLAFVKSEDGESEENAYLEIEDLGSTVTLTVNQSLSNVTGYSVEVSGVDMDTLTDSGNVTQYTFEVPDGNSRSFTVIADIDPSDPGVGLAFEGVTVTDLSPGVASSVTVEVDTVSETKLVIMQPDQADQDVSKIVQINNFTTPAWEEVTESQVSAGTFYPWDIDFDAQGRIYIANNRSFSDDDILFRIDNFTTLNETEVVPSLATDKGITALAIDKEGNKLYYTRGDNLRVVDLSGNLPSLGTDISLSAFTSPNFVSLVFDDESGNLYIADTGTNPDQVVRFNPDTASLVGSAYTSNLDFERATPYWGDQKLADIFLQGAYIYITNHDGADNYKIIQLDKDLGYLDGYGTGVTSFPEESTGLFYGPHHFVAVLNKNKLFVIDEGFDGSTGYDKLVSMDDLDGTGWAVFDPTDFSENSFEFYYAC